jgi:hypothetical protein
MLEHHGYISRTVMSTQEVPGPNAKGCRVVRLKGVARRTIESM